MNRLTFLLSCVLLAVSPQCWSKQGDTYLLPKAGLLTIGVNNADAMYAIGAYAGYGLTPLLSLEVELDASVSGGSYSQTGGNGEYSIWFMGGYATYRFPLTNSFYLKGKLGAIYEDVSNKTPTSGTKGATALGASGGLGLGFRVQPKLTFETEMSVVDQDIIQYSLGAHYAF